MKRLMLAAAVAVAVGGGLLPFGAAAQVTGQSGSKATAESGPTAVEKLNKSLNPGGSSDPDVPLPHPDLANVGPAAPSRAGTQVYGRQEEGGGILGLRMQIPVSRGGASPPPRATP